MTDQGHIKIFPGIEGLSYAAADIFVSLAYHACEVSKHFLVALSGGNTPKRLFHRLVEIDQRIKIPWDGIHVYWVDERNVPPDHPASNYHLANDVLFSQVNMPAENIHRIHGELPIKQAVNSYTDVLKQHASPGLNWPQFDLIFLGLGADGHTASLFPGKISCNEKRRPVIGVTATYEDRPTQRITLTPRLINTARQIVFMVAGKDKARAVTAVLNDPHQPKLLPAQRIEPKDGNIIWLLDQEAAQFINLK